MQLLEHTKEARGFRIGTAWHMKMWVQLWFENIYDKELCYTLYRCTPQMKLLELLISGVLYVDNMRSFKL